MFVAKVHIPKWVWTGVVFDCAINYLNQYKAIVDFSKIDIVINKAVQMKLIGHLEHLAPETYGYRSSLTKLHLS